MNLGDLLATVPDDAIHMAGYSVDRATLHGEADGLASALATSGVQPGQLVAVMLPNGPDVVAALFGVWRSGAVYAPLNPRSPTAELAANLATLRPAAVVTGPGRSLDREGSFALVERSGRSWRVERTVPKAADPARPGPDVALMQFTSGTTGRPRPVPLLHETVSDLIDRVLATLRGSRTARTDRPPMPNLIPVSLSLWAGIYQVLFAFRAGAPIVVMERFETTAFAELVARFGIRSTVLPPAAMTMLTDDRTVTDLAPLRIVRSITAPLTPAGARRFRERFGVTVLNSYGQTELGGEVVGWSAADARAHGDDKLGSVGRPHAGVDVRALDGELVIRTSATRAVRADDGTEIHDTLGDRVDADGWFRTGDLGRVDDDGFVWVDGRASELINRGGLKVFPADVEEALAASGSLREVAVVGVPDDRLGEVPWAFVVTDGEEIDKAELLERCRRLLAPYKVPVRVVAIDSLPRNEIGKVLRRQLVDRARREIRDLG